MTAFDRALLQCICLANDIFLCKRLNRLRQHGSETSTVSLILLLLGVVFCSYAFALIIMRMAKNIRIIRSMDGFSNVLTGDDILEDFHFGRWRMILH